MVSMKPLHYDICEDFKLCNFSGIMVYDVDFL